MILPASGKDENATPKKALSESFLEWFLPAHHRADDRAGCVIGNVHHVPPAKEPRRMMVGEQQIGVFGELHPLVHERYDFSPNPVLAADINMDLLVSLIPDRYDMQPVSAYPPVLEDLAIVVDEGIPDGHVADVISQAGGRIVTNISLFDVYRSEQIGKDKKSLAYSLTYQSTEKTLPDNDVAQLRQRILRRLDQELGAVLRT